ncbi:hypothetical protein [Flavobacterium cerinum]|nr:hypothetical protein [Flavobacterium cerinum]
MKNITFLFCLLFLTACGKEKTAETVKSKVVAVNPGSLDYSKYEITKEGLGPVQLGMSFTETDALLKDFTKEEILAYDFGFDGGGKAWLYKYKNTAVFGIVPARDSDTIIGIAVIDHNLKSADGVHPKMTVAELLALSPKLKASQNLLMDWESIIDRENNREFVFVTSDKNSIANYSTPEESVTPKRLDAPCDWIIIAKHEAQQSDCSIMREGKFMYKDSDGDDIIVTINGEAVTEDHKGGKYVLISKIKWISDCEYENMLVMSTVPKFPLAPGTVMNVTIDKVDGNNIHFTATAIGKSFHGIMKKIK